MIHNQRLSQAVQVIIEETSRLRFQCLCGIGYATKREASSHYAECELLKMVFIGDIIRVANRLGKTPTYAEYQRMQSDAVPSASTMINHGVFDSWNDAVKYARLPITRRRKKRPYGNNA